MEIWDYFEQVERLFAAHSAYPDDAHADIFAAAPDGLSGRVKCKRLGLNDDAFMRVFERVQIIDGEPVREITSTTWSSTRSRSSAASATPVIRNPSTATKVPRMSGSRPPS